MRDSLVSCLTYCTTFTQPLRLGFVFGDLLMSCRNHRKRRSNDSHLDTYQELNPNRVHRPSPTTLTKSTMDAVAVNQPNVRLTRGERMQVAKVILWPYIGDTKAPAVRPRVSESHRLAAERLMRRLKVAA